MYCITHHVSDRHKRHAFVLAPDLAQSVRLFAWLVLLRD